VSELTPVPPNGSGGPFAETRWILEAGRLLIDPVAYGLGVPRGDGRPVVVLPGFLASDDTLVLLRRWLRIVGYGPHTAGFLFNVDCADRALERVERLTEAINATTGRRVAIVGHSRGGHLARAAAARRPELVSHAISMGADLQGLFRDQRPRRAQRSAVVRRGCTSLAGAATRTASARAAAARFLRDYTWPHSPSTVCARRRSTQGDWSGPLGARDRRRGRLRRGHRLATSGLMGQPQGVLGDRDALAVRSLPGADAQ
jgi:pimeloyl-ACP methyl ester carboxylesterase